MACGNGRGCPASGGCHDRKESQRAFLGAEIARLDQPQVAVFLMRSQAFDVLSSLMPEFMRAVAGPSMVTFMSFTGVVSLGYFHPIVLAALLGFAIAIATEPALEAEARFVDLTLARPIARAELVTRTVIVLVVSGAVVLGLMIAGTWIGLACCTP